jgi:hypothetical protein
MKKAIAVIAYVVWALLAVWGAICVALYLIPRYGLWPGPR